MEDVPIRLVATRCTTSTYLDTNILCEDLGLDKCICPEFFKPLYVSLCTTEQGFLSLYVGRQRLEPVKRVGQGHVKQNTVVVRLGASRVHVFDVVQFMELSLSSMELRQTKSIPISLPLSPLI